MIRNNIQLLQSSWPNVLNHEIHEKASAIIHQMYITIIPFSPIRTWSGIVLEPSHHQFPGSQHNQAISNETVESKRYLEFIYTCSIKQFLSEHSHKKFESNEQNILLPSE
jgi:hypothetical protein